MKKFCIGLFLLVVLSRLASKFRSRTMAKFDSELFASIVAYVGLILLLIFGLAKLLEG